MYHPWKCIAQKNSEPPYAQVVARRREDKRTQSSTTRPGTPKLFLTCMFGGCEIITHHLGRNDRPSSRIRKRRTIGSRIDRTTLMLLQLPFHFFVFMLQLQKGSVLLLEFSNVFVRGLDSGSFTVVAFRRRRFLLGDVFAVGFRSVDLGFGTIANVLAGLDLCGFRQ